MRQLRTLLMVKRTSVSGVDSVSVRVEAGDKREGSIILRAKYKVITYDKKTSTLRGDTDSNDKGKNSQRLWFTSGKEKFVLYYVREVKNTGKLCLRVTPEKVDRISLEGTSPFSCTSDNKRLPSSREALSFLKIRLGNINLILKKSLITDT